MILIKSIFVFLALHQVFSTQPINEVTPYGLIEDTINNTLEELRVVIKNGKPEKGIPVLDPFKLDCFARNIDIENVIKANLSINKVSFKGAGDFQVTHLKFTTIVVVSKLEFTATIPRLELFGHYETDGKVMEVIKLAGKGEFGALVDNFNVSGTATLRGTKITNLDLHLFVENVEVQLTGFLNNEGFTEGLVDTLNEMITPMLHQYQKEISSAVSKILLKLLKKKSFMNYATEIVAN